MDADEWVVRSYNSAAGHEVPVNECGPTGTPRNSVIR